MKKLLSVNIEGDRHLARVTPFIAEENPDVICLQEVFRSDLQDIVGSEYQVEFMPACLKPKEGGIMDEWGIAIASREPAWRVIREYYYQPATTLVPVDDTSLETKRKSYRQGVLGISVTDQEQEFFIFTTHFTWTPNGFSNENQFRDMERLLTFMNEQGPHVLCGDFNIPRKQNDVYPLLARVYTDHIPSTYTTSMFLPLHRQKNHPIEAKRIVEFMVDYILSTPNTFSITDVALRGNVSDHYAVVAQVEKLS